ncbi:hypothetical protein [Leptospira sp. GIMC2001]|uniref:hypothetical protein n=1 Tax=Leptospira sp. GIMC2001 TaxID=1513297 RepID=UPI00234AD7C3|nr:hypothetical protein [Leptospira sp. GIMC2001]WCL50367.1 hypothetical protein O4O04_05990 [Leptospira sp. GIMC2001]
MSLFASITKKPLTAHLSFTPGLGAYALEECNSIILNPWIPEKKNTAEPQLILHPEKIIVRKVSLQALLGLLTRSYSLRDIYVLLAEKLGDKDFVLDPEIRDLIRKEGGYNLVVQIRQSPRWTEQSARNHLTKIIGRDPSQKLNELKPRFLLEIFNNHAKLYLALRDKPLYQRGFRSPLSKSAPLSEDIAAILLNQMIQRFFQNQGKGQNKNSIQNFDPKSKIRFVLPFSGTGTLAFEFYLIMNSIAPENLNSLESKHINIWKGNDPYLFLRKKSKASILENLNIIMECYDLETDAVDNSNSNLESFAERIQELRSDILVNSQTNKSKPNANSTLHSKTDRSAFWSFEEGNFFERKIDAGEGETIFLPLNPPYGLRMQKKEENTNFYTRIAEKLIEIEKKNAGNPIFGFLLCPDSETHFLACKVIKPKYKIETVHFSQGNLSLRALFFSRPI